MSQYTLLTFTSTNVGSEQYWFEYQVMINCHACRRQCLILKKIWVNALKCLSLIMKLKSIAWKLNQKEKAIVWTFFKLIFCIESRIFQTYACELTKLMNYSIFIWEKLSGNFKNKVKPVSLCKTRLVTSIEVARYNELKSCWPCRLKTFVILDLFRERWNKHFD